MQKIILFILLSFLSTIVLAETCPSIAEIKNPKLTAWQFYDSDDDKLLSLDRVNHFKKNAHELTLVEWKKNKNQTSAIHCYYRTKDGATLEAYLAKNYFIPENKKHFWYQVSGGMHCAAGQNRCQFTHLAAPKRLANR